MYFKVKKIGFRDESQFFCVYLQRETITTHNTMNLNRLIITVCGMALLLLAVTTVQAATTDERAVVCLTLTDGLAGETVHSVMTDHNGSTWITTSNGVTIYNGKHLLKGLYIVNGRKVVK